MARRAEKTRMNLPKLSRYAAFTVYSEGFDWPVSRLEEKRSAVVATMTSKSLPMKGETGRTGLSARLAAWVSTTLNF